MRLWKIKRDHWGNILAVEIPENAVRYFQVDNCDGKLILMSCLPINSFINQWIKTLHSGSEEEFKKLIEIHRVVDEQKVSIIDFYWDTMLLDLLNRQHFEDMEIHYNFVELLVDFFINRYDFELVTKVLNELGSIVKQEKNSFGDFKYSDELFGLIKNHVLNLKIKNNFIHVDNLVKEEIQKI